MFSSNLRALATALVIGTATLGSVGVLTITTAQAAGLRPSVGNPLKDALAAAQAGNYAQANAKIREAEGIANKTAEEESQIAKTKAYVANKSGDTSTAGGAQAHFNADYNAGHYAQVIAAEDSLRKQNLLTPINQTVIAQAYMLSHNFDGCMRYIRQNFSGSMSEGVLSILRSCAHDGDDKATEQYATEQLVSRFGKPEYWRAMLAQAQRTHGLKDAQTLDIYRLKLLTGSISTPDDYMTLAQLASVQGLPKESQDVVKKGADAKILTGDRITRFAAFSSAQSAKAEAGLAKAQADANASKTGDLLVKLGEYQTSAGNSAEAIKDIQAGIAKGTTDPNFAQVRLGLAYLAAKQKDQAARAFASVKGDPNWVMVARLWGFYARR